MSSNHGKHSPTGGGATISEIKHGTFLVDDISSLYANEEYSDLRFIVDGEAIPAHKVILAKRSEYFRAMLYGGLKESSQNEIVLKEPNKEVFKLLLKYIYTGCISLTNLKEELVLEVLGLAHHYGFTDLEAAISDYLRQTLCINTCCQVYESARLFNLKHLMNVTATFIDHHVYSVLKHESFLQLTPDSLKELLERDSLYAQEVDLFNAVCEWRRANGELGDQRCAEMLSAIRLPLMSLEELLTIVRPTSLLSADAILDAIDTQTFQKLDSNAIRHRGQLRMEENVAAAKFGTTVLQGEMRASLLDDSSQLQSSLDTERIFTRHNIGDGSSPGILVQLGRPSIVNHIKMLLWDRDLRSYSYYVEVSMDQRSWTRIVDHTSYHCRSWQFLHFEPRVVRFVRIVGTNNTMNKVFHIIAFKIMYTQTQHQLQNGIIVPTHNVATSALSAAMTEGVSRSRNALLNGKTTDYDWDSGYTCHQLGSGCIMIQLGQPYMIGSMRLLLWDCDDRSYSYFIEVSVNMWDWELVVDKTHEQCQSWQTLVFEKRPVVFIRITGTHNTANEVFHCVHFECPAQDFTSLEGSANTTQKTGNSNDDADRDEKIVID